MYSEQTLPCRHCGEKHVVKVYGSINASETPELKQAVLDGSAFLWECPHCGQLNLIRNNILYHDPGDKIMIWVTGGEQELEAEVKNNMDLSSLPEGYILRFVKDTGSLIEKVKIFECGLNDIAIELCKYVTRSEISRSGQDKDRLENSFGKAPLRFLRLDGADNELNFSYPLDGRMQMLSIGFNVYEDSLAILGRNPALQDSTSSGFCHVDDNWIDEILT